MEELSYSLHLGNDKNKSKKARRSVKNTETGTTSLSNNAIQNHQQLSKVDKHNLRKYDEEQDLICTIKGTSSIVEEKIENYFNHISNDNKRDLACEIIIELGDITRFDNHKQLIAFCGLDPTIIQSGKSINVHGTISKRGNKYARWILFNISQMVVKLGHQCPNHPVYNYYLTKKAEGKHYYESLTACSTKILRMLYTMCKKNTTFKIN